MVNGSQFYKDDAPDGAANPAAAARSGSAQTWETWMHSFVSARRLAEHEDVPANISATRMKWTLLFIAAALWAVCGFPAGGPLPRGATKTAVLTHCAVADLRTNRLEMVRIVESVATRTGLRKATKWEQEAVDFGNLPRGERVLTQFWSTNSTGKSTLTSVSATMLHGQVVAAVYQSGWQSAPTEGYLEIQSLLIDELRTSFGAQLVIKTNRWEIK